MNQLVHLPCNIEQQQVCCILMSKESLSSFSWQEGKKPLAKLKGERLVKDLVQGHLLHYIELTIYNIAPTLMVLL